MKNSRGKSIKDREGTKQLKEIEDKQQVYNEKEYKSGRKRTNGSARKKKKKTERIHRWENTGINIGSINIAGISLLKIYMLTELHLLDVLCI